MAQQSNERTQNKDRARDATISTSNPIAPTTKHAPVGDWTRRHYPSRCIGGAYSKRHLLAEPDIEPSKDNQ